MKSFLNYLEGETFTIFVDAFEKLSTKKLYTHDGEDEPEYQANQ